MECVHADHSRIKLGVRLQKLPERLRGDIAATGDGDVRMPWAELRFDAHRQCSLLNAFVNLEKMRMRFTDADPDYFWRALCGERSDAGDGQKVISAEVDAKAIRGWREDFPALNDIRH